MTAGTLTLSVISTEQITASSTLAINNTNDAADSYINFEGSGTDRWYLGFDKSDSNKFRITPAGTFTATSSGITILPSGFIGIGTTNPTSGLHINATTSMDGSLIIDLDTATSTVFAVCHSGDGTNDAAATSNVKLVDCNGAPSADYAEMYPTYGSPEPGDVVGLGNKYARTKDGDKISKLTKTTKSYDSSAIGVVSQASGDFNVIGYNIDGRDNPVPVALAGRVRVKVSLENGLINVGDRLTSSSVPGVAMRASKKGQTIGIALNSYDGTTGDNKILMFVNLTHQGE